MKLSQGAIRTEATQSTMHLSAAAIAALNVPGLPASKRGVHFVAEREGWAKIERSGKGGGFLYVVPERWAGLVEATMPRQRELPGIANDIRKPVGRPKGSDFFTQHPEVADAVEALISRQKIAAPRVRELLETRFTELPHIKTLRRYIADLERRKPALLASTRDPDLYKGKYRISLGRADGGVDRAHQVWELDTTPADVLLKDGRFAILGVIDRWSRRVRFMVAPSESGQSVRRLLIGTIEHWGVMPETMVTDQGSGYINASIGSALEALGIEHRPCPPGSPEKKPFVERVFGTFTRERAELLPGYVGHNVAQAQKLRARARKETGQAVIVPQLTAAELQTILDAWVDGVYHVRVHGTLRMTPMRKWQSSPVPAAKAPPRDRLLIALSAMVGTLVVGKRGLRWKNGRYWSPALVPYIGRPVLVRRDEEDLGALFVFDDEGRYIDTAVNAERSGMSEEAFASAARAVQDAHMREARAELRNKQRAFGIDEARDLLLRRDAERAGILVSLPRPTIERSTPQLDSLAPRAAPDLPNEAELARAEARFTPRPRVAETPIAQKVAAADALITAADAGQAVDPAELRRARAYAQSIEYRAEKMLAADFGRQPSSPFTTAKEKSA